MPVFLLILGIPLMSYIQAHEGFSKSAKSVTTAVITLILLITVWVWVS